MATLLELGKAWKHAEAVVDRRHNVAPRDAARRVMLKAEEEITKTRAYTAAGMAVKARIIRSLEDFDQSEIAVSLAKDVLEFTGAADTPTAA